MSKYRIYFYLIFIIVCSFIFSNIVLAEESVQADDPNNYYHIYLDKATIAKGYTVSAFADDIKLSLVPGILSDDTHVDIAELNEVIEMPWRLDRISRVYQFEFRNKQAYDDHSPFYIQFAYDKDDSSYKQVFFFDKNYNTWRPLPTRDFPDENFVRSLIHLPYARIAIFSYPDILGSGKASWYKYKGGDFTASPDFPKGSRLRVYNIENGKYVDVEVNDYGPDRSVHPDRIVDLDKIAFEKIASLGEGVTRVKIEPLLIKPDSSGRELGLPVLGISTKPEILSESAVIMRDSDKKIIWEKDSDRKLPLASLTKLIAMKVFLDTEPDLEELVSYQIKDEENNYKYCNKWEVAKLALSEGEKMTVKDLLYVSIIGSTNNTVETLVRTSKIKRDDFIQKMNDYVLELGASSTSFIEPTGLSPQNVSSARDYAIISKEILSNKLIQDISASSEHSIVIINGDNKREKLIKNTNFLVRENNILITGSKTGYLDEAGYCLMTRAKDAQGNQVIVVNFGSKDRTTNFYETKELIRYGLREISK